MAGKDGHDGRPVLGRLFVDDMSMPQRSAKERIVELDEERENIDEDIFDISKVE